eukprot:scaffold202148_cov18-Tisochrysis_lutea.AAC.1
MMCMPLWFPALQPPLKASTATETCPTPSMLSQSALPGTNSTPAWLAEVRLLPKDLCHKQLVTFKCCSSAASLKGMRAGRFQRPVVRLGMDSSVNRRYTLNSCRRRSSSEEEIPRKLACACCAAACRRNSQCIEEQRADIQHARFWIAITLGWCTQTMKCCFFNSDYPPVATLSTPYSPKCARHVKIVQ